MTSQPYLTQSIYTEPIGPTDLGLHSNAVYIIIPTTNKNSATNHYRWREYISCEVQSGKFLNIYRFICHFGDTGVNPKQIDTSWAGTDTNQPGKKKEVVDQYENDQINFRSSFKSFL